MKEKGPVKVIFYS